MFFLDHGDGFAVVASNGASKRTPAWWLNLQDASRRRGAGAREDARDHGPCGRRAGDAALWPLFVELYSGYEHYESIATRELPVVILEPR